MAKTKGPGVKGVYVQEINGIRKVFDYPSHLLKDTREKLDPWLNNFKMWPDVCEQIRSAQVDLRNMSHIDLGGATSAKPCVFEFPDAPMKAVVKIWKEG